MPREIFSTIHSTARPIRARWLGVLCLLLAGLTGVAASPRLPVHGRKRAVHATARRQGERASGFIKAPGSVSAVEKELKRLDGLRKQGKAAEADWLEAYLWRLRQRAYPRDTVDWGAYRRAMLQRDRMPAARITGSRRPGVHANVASRWEFLGPNGLSVPYRIYYGEGSLS